MNRITHSAAYDILIAGAGFAGSLMALVLKQAGFRVCLLEKGSHPRFAIGESSTPVADMILRGLSATYDLPWLQDFSRYGSWQRSHPEVLCGLKRGFSFFKHHAGCVFASDETHSQELLVAASPDDERSDTNWLRSDVDGFLARKVIESGIDYYDRTDVTALTLDGNWKFSAVRPKGSLALQADFLIDATGSGRFLQRFLDIGSSSGHFKTDSMALFSHFQGVRRWTDLLKEQHIPTKDYPFDPDHSALHQVLDEGWMWILRFKDDRTSVGFALDRRLAAFGQPPAQIWDDLLTKYPSLRELLRRSVFHPDPGHLVATGRLQRQLQAGHGPGWVALPHTIGFIDPLFSSGIAHSLSGVERLAQIFKASWGNSDVLHTELGAYERKVFEELRLTDTLVAGCYHTMQHFPLFNAWSMLYFAATISHEQRRLKGKDPGYYLNADDPCIREMVDGCYEALLGVLASGTITVSSAEAFTRLIRDKIAPFNSAALLEPCSKNMYRHTVANLGN